MIGRWKMCDLVIKLERTGPIDWTPGTPGPGKKSVSSMPDHPQIMMYTCI